MEDDHVDRPDVEAGQPVQLTGTNSSFGLIVLILEKLSAKAQLDDKTILLHGSRQSAFGNRQQGSRSRLPDADCRMPVSVQLSLAGLVALSKAIRPDPIPNSAVKRLSANGTSSQDAGE